MGARRCILAIDQGTTSSRAIVFDDSGQPIAGAQEAFPQIYPARGWVEHDPETIWQTTLSTARKAFEKAEAGGCEVAAIGITNQRETTLLWERESGKALHKAIVWQDRRTAELCRRLKEDGAEDDMRARTGLLLDPYFSATKLGWMLDHVDGARAKAENGEALFGTVDSFLLWRLTGEKSHRTDVTNASRTGLMNLRSLQWDDELLRLFKIPRAALPEIAENTAAFGETDPELFGRAVPVLAMAGDQQAASVGQCCFAPGAVKSTYGTGCFVLMNTGTDIRLSKNRLLATVAYALNGETAYSLEGSIFIAGAAVQWLRDEMGLIESAGETEGLASGLDGNDGVYMVPAFTGLGAPHWDPDARGAVFGLTRATTPAHFVRAALESVCYQTHDLVAAMAEDGLAPETLRVDGGMVGNDWMVQFLTDILEIAVDRPTIRETTALGAAYLAGLEAGLFGSFADIERHWQAETRFKPRMESGRRNALLDGWADAVRRVKSGGS